MGKFLQIFTVPDLRKKVFMVLIWLVLFRALAAIPIPGVNPEQVRNFFAGNEIFGLFNLFSGGALSNLSVIMLGVGPYITATIIMQLLTMIFPRLKEIYYEEGAAGRAKFNRYSRWLTIPLAFFQSYAFLRILASQNVVGSLSKGELVINVLAITAGSAILMWIGELISEYKIGNGISLLIFAGIVSSLPSFISQIVTNPGQIDFATYIAFGLLSLLIIAGVVFVSQGERKIPISYSKRIRGNRMYGGSVSYLPLKVNQAGVIPIIFAISILIFPQFIAQLVAIFSVSASNKVAGIMGVFYNNQILYSIAYFLLVVVFTYFYTAITFDPKEISKNLQRSGGFIPGIRPGDPSGEFLSKLTKRITLFGAIFLGLIAVLPNITQIVTGTQLLTLGGTSLLIVVAVALETMKQIDSQLVLREYEGLE
ncbi:MAG: preprotein translocase subunit SecY [Candidatus Harrisonbacteria bacterium CG10_big_fil_rev_8_21_14_0_10_40_38]|uniref:Protein translocase subunit SecY n=1 Tax=Candidatus Harrisonbacteria bacterium CG10_big_fil_rev_8_21_14_0_10_40_38 TaxID=1974583 RepID=A0A2H0USG4_9BACT|nr:MAG: preprotein translocase subunit SecY [Candidatus Harrisonbacteria bacterium CG10_big_fil_rev_8_21_14_0_10_40_38]